MYEHTPTPDRRVGMALALAMACLGLILFLPLGLAMWLEASVHCLGFWLVILSFPVAERWALTTFTYVVSRDTESGVLEFTVTERRRRRSRVVCRVWLSSLTAICLPNEKPRFGKKVRRFNYCPDLRRRCHYLVLEDEGVAVLRFCPDKELERLFLSFIEGKKD